MNKPALHRRWLPAGTLLLLPLLAWLTPLPFPWKNTALALIGVLLWVGCYRDWRSIGLARPASWLRTLGIATVVAAIIIFGIGDLLSPLLDWLTGRTPDYTAYETLVGNFDAVSRYWAQAMLSAAVAEEVLYRGLVIACVLALLPNYRHRETIAVATSILLFTLPHANQGPAGLALVAASALVFGIGYLRSGKNLYAMIIAHALVDSWGLTSIYLGAHL